jgi:hypothetical protein
MSKTNAFETELLELLFNNADITLLGDAAGVLGSAVAGSLYVSLHTSIPDEGGDQTTGEISYTGYARVAVARSGAGWTVSGNSVSPFANIDFGAMTGGAGGLVTYFGVGVSVSGGGKLLYYGTVTPNINVVNGVTPRLTTATAITED